MVTEWREVPKDAAGFVIGRQAENVKRINRRSGAWAMIDHSFKGDGVRRFYVTESM